MTYRIRLTDRARGDLFRLLDSLDERTPGSSARLSTRFEEALARLERFPLACGLAYENHSVPEEIRHLLFGFPRGRKYRALFTVRDDEVVILAIRAPGEKPVSPDDMAG